MTAVAKPKPMRRYSLEWNNPHTQPPDGKPRVLAEAVVPWDEEPTELFAMHVLGSGWGIHVRTVDLTPPRRLSEQAKQSIRRKRLVRRLNDKAPLFASQLIPVLMARKPDYYGAPLEVQA